MMDDETCYTGSYKFKLFYKGASLFYKDFKRFNTFVEHENEKEAMVAEFALSMNDKWKQHYNPFKTLEDPALLDSIHDETLHAGEVDRRRSLGTCGLFHGTRSEGRRD